MQSLVCEVLFTQLLHQGILIRRLNHGLAQLLPHVLLQNLFPLGIVHRIKFGFPFLDGCVKGRIKIAREVVVVSLASQATSAPDEGVSAAAACFRSRPLYWFRQYLKCAT